MKIEVTNSWFSFCDNDKHQFIADKPHVACQCGDYIYGDALKALDKINFTLQRSRNDKVISVN
jgi:hypothetical protein